MIILCIGIVNIKVQIYNCIFEGTNSNRRNTKICRSRRKERKNRNNRRIR